MDITPLSLVKIILVASKNVIIIIEKIIETKNLKLPCPRIITDPKKVPTELQIEHIPNIRSKYCFKDF